MTQSLPAKLSFAAFAHGLLGIKGLFVLAFVGFLVGLAMSLLQILTSIQDSAFSAVPRLLAFLAAFIIAMPWMLNKMTSYAVLILGDLSRYGR